MKFYLVNWETWKIILGFNSWSKYFVRMFVIIVNMIVTLLGRVLVTVKMVHRGKKPSGCPSGLTSGLPSCLFNMWSVTSCVDPVLYQTWQHWSWPYFTGEMMSPVWWPCGWGMEMARTLPSDRLTGDWHLGSCSVWSWYPTFLSDKKMHDQRTRGNRTVWIIDLYLVHTSAIWVCTFTCLSGYCIIYLTCAIEI